MLGGNEGTRGGQKNEKEIGWRILTADLEEYYLHHNLRQKRGGNGRSTRLAKERRLEESTRPKNVGKLSRF